MSRPGVLIADDHPLFRRGLRAVIEETGRYTVVAEAADGPSAIAQVGQIAPDLAVIDLSMPGSDGFAVAGWIGEHAPTVRRIVMTMHRERIFVDRALQLGVAGYLLKDDAYDEVVRCLDAVAGGSRFVSPSLGADDDLRHPVLQAEDVAQLRALTPTQREVLRHLADYATSKEIARRMGLSHRTVENHRANIAAALNLRGQNRLLALAARYRTLLQDD